MGFEAFKARLHDAFIVPNGSRSDHDDEIPQLDAESFGRLAILQDALERKGEPDDAVRGYLAYYFPSPGSVQQVTPYLDRGQREELIYRALERMNGYDFQIYVGDQGGVPYNWSSSDVQVQFCTNMIALMGQNGFVYNPAVEETFSPNNDHGSTRTIFPYAVRILGYLPFRGEQDIQAIAHNGYANGAVQ